MPRRDIGQHFWIVGASEYCGKAKAGCRTTIMHSNLPLGNIVRLVQPVGPLCLRRRTVFAIQDSGQKISIGRLYRKLKASHSSTLHTPINFTFCTKKAESEFPSRGNRFFLFSRICKTTSYGAISGITST